ncbi:hypothetical protein P4H67_09020 [Paenibacillus lautus]|uniref:hypothetical protein n=1 Tax=Paenibacillus lautus TaxID=1401 RepID=UPI002DBF589A|nr:hypothetical protein [Paenibacillus lautus]MEC0306897.1 hypothetical protein [Paenibacillus lautus]
MPGVAIHGSLIREATKSNHVRYSIEYWNPCYSDDCTGHIYWLFSGYDYTNAKINGAVSASNRSVRTGGAYIATVGDNTNENWFASPPVPTSNSQTRYTAITPTSGNDVGRINQSGGTVFIGGKAVAKIGSQVTTCLGELTTITTGSSNVFTR